MVSLAPQPAERPSIVIVGGGMASFALLRRLDHAGVLPQYRVTLLGEEPRPCYDRVNLTDSFFNKSPDELLLAPREWYVERGVELVTGDRVVSINREAKSVTTESGRHLDYDRLVLATGSRPFVPPIEGVELPGVFVYRTIEDVQQIREYAANCKTAAVLGGGLLGLEAGKALVDMGVQTHVADVAPSLMPRQLNAEAGAVLKHEVEKLGVDIRLLHRAERIEQQSKGLAVHFSGHEPIEVEMLVISAGIRPRDELARDVELPLGPRGGVAVDAKMQTEDEAIYAIGECAAVEGELFGLIGPCNQMAEVVADNLAAEQRAEEPQAAFAGQWTGTRLKLMGVEVTTLGLPIEESEGTSRVISAGEGYCRTLLLREGRLVGAIGVGDWPERDILSAAIAERRRVPLFRRWGFKNNGTLLPDVERELVSKWPAKATICGCVNVTRGELTEALLAGAEDAEGLAEATGASTVCGSCRNLLCELAGQEPVIERPKGRRGLLIGSAVALLTIVLGLILGPAPTAETVQSAWRGVDELWRNGVMRQITGYTLLAVSIIALALSLRKRVSWVKLGDFGTWRGAHGLIGAATLIGFLVHTGMRLGHNFTFALAAIFLLLNVLGAFTGITASLEATASGAAARRLRAWRPWLTQFHIWLFWPLPVLIVFHIISVYYY